MRDPRLVEIDFLMDLERQEDITVVVEKTGGATVGEETSPYGTDPRRFREMIDYLFHERLITGTILWEYNRPRTFYLTHAGRVHLWQQRDALLRDPDLEPFGLRSKAAWHRDLSVRLRWATVESPLTVMFLDLDNFGRVNKEFGHPVGDEVLRSAFNLIKGIAGTRGHVYRCGGEEVGVLLPATTLDEGARIAEEIRSVVAHEVHRQVKALNEPQTVSIGVAAFEASLDDDSAIRTVDTLMRAAKRGGKNRVEVTT